MGANNLLTTKCSGCFCTGESNEEYEEVVEILKYDSHKSLPPIMEISHDYSQQ